MKALDLLKNLRSDGVTMGQAIIMLMAHDRDITTTDVARELNISASSASNIIKRLIQMSHLKAGKPTEGDDMRVRPYILTTQAKDLLKSAFGRK